ncbi:MAG: GntR family transcriptional regulator [Pseudomonadota bacterium]
MSSKENCFRDLQQRILTTELEPGSGLDEVSLSESYRISRTPLREVLQRLAGEGYVEIESNRGAKVASMNVAAMRTFFQTAPMIYANISRQAAENRKRHQLDNLGDIQRGFLDAIAKDDVSGAALCNHTFHAIIGQMAHNPYLMACLDRLLIDHTRLGHTFYRPAAPADRTLIRNAADQHDAMISAIEAQDADLSVDLALQHWDLSRDRIERFVRPDPLPVDLPSLKERHHAV